MKKQFSFFLNESVMLMFLLLTHYLIKSTEICLKIQDNDTFFLLSKTSVQSVGHVTIMVCCI